jgi:hypothetical protein
LIENKMGEEDFYGAEKWYKNNGAVFFSLGSEVP